MIFANYKKKKKKRLCNIEARLWLVAIQRGVARHLKSLGGPRFDVELDEALAMVVARRKNVFRVFPEISECRHFHHGFREDEWIASCVTQTCVRNLLSLY